MKLEYWGLVAIVVSAYITGHLFASGMVSWPVSLIMCAITGIASGYYLHQMRTEYGNDLFLKTLTKAKQEGIKITVTNAVCPHCGKNIFEDVEP
jgi:hypothetical protein